jgi:MoaA/NifB/PqqE/SkfB family radical SAM enzyme
MLNTNGLMLPNLLKRNPDLFKQIDILIISLDSTDPNVLDHIYRSRKGDGQRVIDIIKTCNWPTKESGCKLVVNCVITEETIDDAMNVIRFCHEEDIMFAPVPANRGKGLMHYFQDIKEYGALVDKMLSRKGPRLFGSKKVFHILMRFKSFECHPSLRIHITPDGMIPWPCQSDQRFRLPILGYESLNALLNDAEKRHSVQNHGRICKSQCYLVQNVSTHVYLENPLVLTISAVRDLLIKI